MKFAFFGTPNFAATILKELVEAGLAPALIICNPDRPAGRKQVVTPPPTKIIGEASGIPVWQPEKLLASECSEKLAGMDFAVVAAYAKIISGEIIAQPRLGMIGVHPSLLPKYRGTTPIQSAILSGESVTGTTLFILDEKVDHGAIIAQAQAPLVEAETYTSLEKKLALLSGRLLIEKLPLFQQGAIKPIPQIETEATMTKKFKTEDGFVDAEKMTTEEFYRKVRALNPQPGAYAIKNGLRVKIIDRETVQHEGRTPKKVKDAIFYLKSL